MIYRQLGWNEYGPSEWNLLLLSVLQCLLELSLVISKSATVNVVHPSTQPRWGLPNLAFRTHHFSYYYWYSMIRCFLFYGWICSCFQLTQNFFSSQPRSPRNSVMFLSVVCPLLWASCFIKHFSTWSW